ncbi:hypothetical protein Mapa_002843 [Marchantia paleacea]|nr:hypothetical protein Mapa_002843 [Marchantia paleacea]
MGSALSSTGFEEDDTKGRNESVDPVLEKLRNLHVVMPILKTPTGDSSLTDLLLRRTPSQSASEALDPTTTAKLFALYQEWQRVTAANIAKNQDMSIGWTTKHPEHGRVRAQNYRCRRAFFEASPEVDVCEPCHGVQCCPFNVCACSAGGSHRDEADSDRNNKKLRETVSESRDYGVTQEKYQTNVNQ